MLQPTRIESIRTHICGHWIFVTVTTESGLTGIGESTYFLHPPAIAAIVEDLQETYLGQDPYRPEFLYQRVLKKHCMIDAASASAMAAIDQALWDIKGKALEVPVWQLLGGRVRDRVRAIVLVQAPTEEELLAKAIAAKEDGFTAIKIKPFIGDWSLHSSARILQRTSETVKAARDAIGWDVDLAVEVHRNLAPDQAIQFAELVRDQRLYFIEDPVQPFSVSVNKFVSEGMPSPVALAERNINIWEFREYSDCSHVSILRPDVGLAGGFTQMKKIAAIAESRHQRILPHNFTSPLVTACHVQLAACTQNWDVQGYVRETDSPWCDVVKDINRVSDGFIEIPETPGIGMELDFEYIDNHGYVPFGSKFGHVAFPAVDGGIKQQ
ncbi:mandelate racemase/muconate lactonizing enzyme family protein [Pseudomaricurvus alkylphenolicus]|uniref:mandelate racemase/muconate lactonizing enzyme family protein n=1 Tax=Pseudomaricurvus alkylphenolicus TaxID=1306991 RepID=UPI00141FEAF7|nr:mandelate racemase/muconate lactonizing enzyme family protein [Pseudomaricurvus alkylphenolicus]NIB42477.1 mandelate racemase/muconate lactonizing enzyme family protein [Pseudomaricurvus alkylphenolicus]